MQLIISKRTSQQEHQAGVQALDDTCSGKHSTHQFQGPAIKYDVRPMPEDIVQ